MLDNKVAANLPVVTLESRDRILIALRIGFHGKPKRRQDAPKNREILTLYRLS